MNRLDQRVNVVPPFFSIVLQDGEVGEKLHVGVFLVDALGGPSSSQEGVIGRSERAFEIAAQAALGILKSLTINRAKAAPVGAQGRLTQQANQLPHRPAAELHEFLRQGWR